MKLLKLIISAFGPFKEKQEIDFNKISNRKLFLITGPTGAGKTTIFDAICYALYGQSSGNKRDGDSLRSDFSPVKVETFVSLTFCLKGKKYKVFRSPKQEKPKQRGEGLTIKQSEAILEVEDGKTYAGVYEVDKKIQEILGIDCNQFRQIVMLPQGEFRKLLEASSQERELIFRKIFKTDSFLNIQEYLKTKTNIIKQKIADKNKLLENNLMHILCSKEELLSELKEEKSNDYEKVIKLLDIKISQGKNKLDNIQKTVELKENIIYQLTSEIEKGQIINQKFDKRNNLDKQKKELNKKKLDIERLELLVKKGANAKIISQIEDQKSKCEKNIDALNIKIDDELQKRTIKEKNNNILKKEFEEIKQEYEKLDNYQKELIILNEYLNKYKLYETKETQKKESEEIYLKYKDSFTKCKQEMDNIEINLNNYDKIDISLGNYKVKQEKLNNLREKYDLYNSYLFELKELFVEKEKLSIKYQKINSE